MYEKIDQLQQQLQAATATTSEELEAFRLRYISKKGELTPLFAEMKNVAPEERKNYGQRVNQLKQLAAERFAALKEQLEGEQQTHNPHHDLTLPAVPAALGSMHPVTLVRNEIVDIFSRIGFNVEDGPEIEDDFHNFTALNFPPDHPAREMQDTFFIERKPDMLLRTHTSNVQVRLMNKQKPPIRSIMPGRVYRNEAISARSHCQFHQIEGLYINKGVSFQELKNTLYYFARQLFGEDTKVRFRPSYFPFTEPSAEMDIYWGLETEADKRITKGTGWLEILGCGMVDPEVLNNSGIDCRRVYWLCFRHGYRPYCDAALQN